MWPEVKLVFVYGRMVFVYGTVVFVFGWLIRIGQGLPMVQRIRYLGTSPSRHASVSGLGNIEGLMNIM